MVQGRSQCGNQRNRTSSLDDSSLGTAERLTSLARGRLVLCKALHYAQLRCTHHRWLGRVTQHIYLSSGDEGTRSARRVRAVARSSRAWGRRPSPWQSSRSGQRADRPSSSACLRGRATARPSANRRSSSFRVPSRSPRPPRCCATCASSCARSRSPFGVFGWHAPARKCSSPSLVIAFVAPVAAGLENHDDVSQIHAEQPAHPVADERIQRGNLRGLPRPKLRWVVHQEGRRSSSPED